MNEQKIIFFVFAGREENMELQWPYINRLLEIYPNAEYHVWDLTRNEADHAYVQALCIKHDRVKVFSHLWPGRNNVTFCRKKLAKPRWCNCVGCRPAPFEKVYEFYAADQSTYTSTHDFGSTEVTTSPYANTVFVKLDDDIVFIETERFNEVLGLLAANPTRVVSANVVNNVVSAKHDPDLRPRIEKAFRPQTFKAWFDLHAEAEYANLSHRWFLDNAEDLLDPHRPVESERSLPGERMSINFIAMNFATLCRVNAVVEAQHSKLGDEGAINHNFLPWITVSFRVAHLYFGPQRVHMEDQIEELRLRYANLSKEYLA